MRNRNVLGQIINAVMGNEEPCVKKEAVWAISNATANCNSEQIRAIVACRGIDALVHWLRNCQQEVRSGVCTYVPLSFCHFVNLAHFFLFLCISFYFFVDYISCFWNHLNAFDV